MATLKVINTQTAEQRLLSYTIRGFGNGNFGAVPFGRGRVVVTQTLEEKSEQS